MDGRLLFPCGKQGPLCQLGRFAFVYKLWGRDNRADCSCWWVELSWLERPGKADTLLLTPRRLLGQFSVINQKEFRQQILCLGLESVCLMSTCLMMCRAVAVAVAFAVAVCGTCELGKFMHGFTFLRVIICYLNYACWVAGFVVELLQTISRPKAKCSLEWLLMSARKITSFAPIPHCQMHSN